MSSDFEVANERGRCWEEISTQLYNKHDFYNHCTSVLLRTGILNDPFQLSPRQRFVHSQPEISNTIKTKNVKKIFVLGFFVLRLRWVCCSFFDFLKYLLTVVFFSWSHIFHTSVNILITCRPSQIAKWQISLTFHRYISTTEILPWQGFRIGHYRIERSISRYRNTFHSPASK